MQGVVNVVVLLMLLATVILGATMVLPMKSPLGILMGKMASQKGMISGMLSTLDPKVLAAAMNADPDMMSELLEDLDPEMVAEAVNSNGEWIAELIGYLDPVAMSTGMSDNVDFMLGYDHQRIRLDLFIT